MNRVVLRPKLRDLATADPHLRDLHRYALHLVKGRDQRRAAENASLLYLTMMHAFQQAGLTDLEWSPNLCLELDDQEYEVSDEWSRSARRFVFATCASLKRRALPPVPPTSPSHVVSSCREIFNKIELHGANTSQDSVASASLMSVDQTGGEPETTDVMESHEAPRQSTMAGRRSEATSSATERSIVRVGSKRPGRQMDVLIQAIAARDPATLPIISTVTNNNTLETQHDTITVELGMAMNTLVTGGMASASDPVFNAIPSVDRSIETSYSEIEQLDRRAMHLSVVTNWAYYRLGQAYERFCRDDVDEGVDWQSRMEQQRCLSRLCQLPFFSSAALPGKPRFALTKRLQRARKFLALADALGPRVLQVVPEVCVSRIDLVRLEDILDLLRGDGFLEEVEAIRGRMAEAIITNDMNRVRISKRSQDSSI